MGGSAHDPRAVNKTLGTQISHRAFSHSFSSALASLFCPSMIHTLRGFLSLPPTPTSPTHQNLNFLQAATKECSTAERAEGEGGKKTGERKKTQTQYLHMIFIFSVTAGCASADERDECVCVCSTGGALTLQLQGDTAGGLFG